MAERFEAFRRFDYRLNSNLVIQKETHVPSSNEPTGEPESLAGRKLCPMGDKVVRSSAREVHQALYKKKGDQPSLQRSYTASGAAFNLKAAREFKKNIKKDGSILDTDLSNIHIYQPSTKETTALYEQLLSELVNFLGDQPEDVMIDAAEEILRGCRDLDLKETQKKSVCESILGPLTQEKFTELYQLTRSLHDYSIPNDTMQLVTGAPQQDSSIGDVSGVAVVFDEDDEKPLLAESGNTELLGDLHLDQEEEADDEEDLEDDNDHLLENVDSSRKYGHVTDLATSTTDGTKLSIRPHESYDSSSALEKDQGSTARGAQSIGIISATFNDSDDEVYIKQNDKLSLNVRTIDSHWLQRELNKFFGEPEVVINIEKRILEALTTPDLQECENKLIYLLKYDNFNFARLLLHNRWKVYYCTKLGQAQGEAQKEEIRQTMSESPQGQEVLEELKSVKLRVNKEKEFARNVRREAAILAERSSQHNKSQPQDELLLNAPSCGRSHPTSAVSSVVNDSSNSASRYSAAAQTGLSACSQAKQRSSHRGTDALLDEQGFIDLGLKPASLLNLEAMAFSDGGRFMANSVVKLKENSQRLEKKDYDEVIISAITVSPMSAIQKDSAAMIDDHMLENSHLPIKMDDDDDCASTSQTSQAVSIDSLPDWCQPPFNVAGVKKLNIIQSTVFPVAFEQHDKNLLVCAPTGAGKTNIAVLSILGLMKHHMQKGQIDKKEFKIVYLSPMKALVAEQVAAFQKRFAHYDFRVEELTGDTNMTRQQIEETQIIVATPEKWDVVTRKSKDCSFSQLVKLLIIDEIHLLHDSRGPVIEAIVARTLRQIESTQELVRIVALSATLPNYMDAAIFLRVSLKENEGLFVFGAHHRPVPLMQTYIGLKEKKAVKRLTTMNRLTYEKVLENAGKNQVLIFVHSRKETVRTAKMLRQAAIDEETFARILQEDSASREILQTEAEALKTPELKDLLPYGFAVHHAGLPRTDRRLIEDLFADRHIQVLVSTATLAWGVNLPAHTVIIKGTQVYSPEKGKWTELSALDVMQMMGRAGRPQYDTSGHGIIITNHSELQFYLSLNNQQLPIESQMLSALPDHLNAEIAAGTIATRKDAVQWLGYTYLYVRLLRNPALYGLPEDIRRSGDNTLEQVRTDIAHAALLTLDKHQLIRYERRTGIIQGTILGRIASHYYIKYPSLAVFNENLRPTFSDIELLRLFSLSHEFQYIPVREEEKVELSKLLERIPIPVKGSTSSAGNTVEDTSTKVNVLLQAYISKLSLDGFALAADMTYIKQNAGRIMRAIFEITLRRGWAQVARRALLYSSMIRAQMWAMMSPLRQYPNALPEALIKKLEKKDISWERYVDLSATELGELVRQPKQGKIIHKLIHSIPRLDLSAYIQPLTRSTLLVELSVLVDFRWDHKYHDPSGEIFWIFVEDGDGSQILHHEQIMIKQYQVQQDDFELLLEFAVPLTEPLPPNYFIRCISDRWIHSETVLPVSFKNLILPDKNAPPTELLDLQPLPVSALKYPEVEQYYHEQRRLKFFAPIETQVLPALYHSNDNVFVCAPPTFKHLSYCAEFAILRMLRHESSKKAVFVTVHASHARNQYEMWQDFFGKLHTKVALLSGSMNTDLSLIADSDLILATAEHWNHISTRWKTRKVFQKIGLFIIDHLELLDSRDGATIEVCISRIRYISAQLPEPIRFVGLSVSLSNAVDVAGWLGVENSSLFNFANQRSDLRIHLEGYDTYHQIPRLHEMAKPVFQWIKRCCGQHLNHQVIVVCSERKQLKVSAIDLLLFAASENQPRRFLRDQAPIEIEVSLLEKTLQHALSLGVGYLHEGMTNHDMNLVISAYQQLKIQVLLITQKIIWDVQLAANLVIVQDTNKYDARLKSWVHYAMVDIFRMMSLAQGNPDDSEERSAVFVLMCPQHRYAYYDKFKNEPLPLESCLDQNLADYFSDEIAIKTIESKQDAVDWLTWTFYYRRMAKNPNYYGLTGVTPTHLSEHLSKLVESATDQLCTAKCIEIDPDDDVTIAPLNLGLIAAFYHIRYMTLDLFSRSLDVNSKRKAILEVLCAATEFTEFVPIRHGEEQFLWNLSKSVGVKLRDVQGEFADISADVSDPNIKALLLLYAHMHRFPLSASLQYDQEITLKFCVRLLYAMIDVISSNAWLEPAIIAMECCQCVVQALRPTESPLLQLPYIDQAFADNAKKVDIQDIFDLINADETREQLLKCFTPVQIEAIAAACNRYPVFDVEYSVLGAIVEKTEMKDENDEESKTFKGLMKGATTQIVVELIRAAVSFDK